eukprot:6202859-Pleurochrysis_carterae.AAC.2
MLSSRLPKDDAADPLCDGRRARKEGEGVLRSALNRWEVGRAGDALDRRGQLASIDHGFDRGASKSRSHDPSIAPHLQTRGALPLSTRVRVPEPEDAHDDELERDAKVAHVDPKGERERVLPHLPRHGRRLESRAGARVRARPHAVNCDAELSRKQEVEGRRVC